MQTDYKSKYKELKLKLKDMVDLSFRLGVQEGLRQSQIQQAQQAAQAPQPGQPGQDGQMPSDQEAGAQEAQGADQGQPTQNSSELDHHISELESMLQKTDTKSPEYAVLSKSLAGIKAHQSSIKQREAQALIKSIGKNLKKPFALGNQATRNMQEPAKKSLNMQEQLVKGIMDGWAKEEEQVKNKLNQTLGIEGLLKS